MYPDQRPRRLRSSSVLRDLVSEYSIDHKKMIMPVFVNGNIDKKMEIKSMPGIFNYPLNGELEDYARSLNEKGVRSVILFGIPDHKDSEGSDAFSEKGVVQRAIQYFKSKGMFVITDLCMCEYTDHGHCGIVKGNDVDNDETLSYYERIAVSQAKSGSDMIAPSGMMDGQVASIRKALDSHGFKNIPIMAYSAKYASSLYGPFRDAAQSKPGFGDRKTYQMNPSNMNEAMKEIEMDIQEGADIVMVKPATFYLDIIRLARERFNVPIAAYSVSGEYSMIMNAVRSGFLDESAITEQILSIFRAGASMVISYFTEYLAEKHRNI
ncbi:porphobilinogen synthase [Caldiplasma sukawensis]